MQTDVGGGGRDAPSEDEVANTFSRAVVHTVPRKMTEQQIVFHGVGGARG
jgi:hypothetical protein